MRTASPKLTTDFAREEGGATAVEFALLAAPLIGIALAALQTSMIFSYDQALQSVTETAARQLMTGAAQTSGMSQSQFQSLICSYGAAVFNCGSLMVDVESGSTYSSINTTPIKLTYNSSGAVTNTFNYSPGNPGDIVIIRVMYEMPVVGGNLVPGLSNQSNGDHLLTATAVIKNEPYG